MSIDYNKKLTLAEIKYKNKLKNGGMNTDNLDIHSLYNAAKNNDSDTISSLLSEQANGEVNETTSSNVNNDRTTGRNAYQKTENSLEEITFNLKNGFYNFFEGLGDLGAGLVGTVAGWTGNKDVEEGAKNFIDYDWSAAAAKLDTNVTNYGFDLLSGDAFKSDYWDLTETGTANFQSDLYNGGLVDDNANSALKAIHNGANELETTIGQMLPSIALAILTGGASTTASASTAAETLGTRAATSVGSQGLSKFLSVSAMSIGAGGGAVEESLKDGATLGSATLYGLADGTVEGLTEYALGALGKAGSKTVELVTNGKYTGETLTKLLPNSFGGLFAQNASKTTIGKVVGTFVEEGTEEVLSDLANPLIKSIYNGKSVSENYQDKDEFSISKMSHSFLMGGLSALIMGGADISASAKNGKNVNALLETMQSKSSVYNDAAKLISEGNYNDDTTFNKNRKLRVMGQIADVESEVQNELDKFSSEDYSKLYDILMDSSASNAIDFYTNKIKTVESDINTVKAKGINEISSEEDRQVLLNELTATKTNYEKSLDSAKNDFTAFQESEVKKYVSQINQDTANQLVNDEYINKLNKTFNKNKLNINVVQAQNQDEYNRLVHSSNSLVGSIDNPAVSVSTDNGKIIVLSPSVKGEAGRSLIHEFTHGISVNDKIVDTTYNNMINIGKSNKEFNNSINNSIVNFFNNYSIPKSILANKLSLQEYLKNNKGKNAIDYVGYLTKTITNVKDFSSTSEYQKFLKEKKEFIKNLKHELIASIAETKGNNMKETSKLIEKIVKRSKWAVSSKSDSDLINVLTKATKNAKETKSRVYKIEASAKGTRTYDELMKDETYIFRGKANMPLSKYDSKYFDYKGDVVVTGDMLAKFVYDYSGSFDEEDSNRSKSYEDLLDTVEEINNEIQGTINFLNNKDSNFTAEDKKRLKNLYDYLSNNSEDIDTLISEAGEYYQTASDYASEHGRDFDKDDISESDLQDNLNDFVDIYEDVFDVEKKNGKGKITLKKLVNDFEITDETKKDAFYQKAYILSNSGMQMGDKDSVMKAKFNEVFESLADEVIPYEKIIDGTKKPIGKQTNNLLILNALNNEGTFREFKNYVDARIEEKKNNRLNPHLINNDKKAIAVARILNGLNTYFENGAIAKQEVVKKEVIDDGTVLKLKSFSDVVNGIGTGDDKTTFALKINDATNVLKSLIENIGKVKTSISSEKANYINSIYNELNNYKINEGKIDSLLKRIDNIVGTFNEDGETYKNLVGFKDLYNAFTTTLDSLSKEAKNVADKLIKPEVKVEKKTETTNSKDNLDDITKFITENGGTVTDVETPASQEDKIKNDVKKENESNKEFVSEQLTNIEQLKNGNTGSLKEIRDLIYSKKILEKGFEENTKQIYSFYDELTNAQKQINSKFIENGVLSDAYAEKIAKVINDINNTTESLISIFNKKANELKGLSLKELKDFRSYYHTFYNKFVGAKVAINELSHIVAIGTVAFDADNSTEFADKNNTKVDAESNNDAKKQLRNYKKIILKDKALLDSNDTFWSNNGLVHSVFNGYDKMIKTAKNNLKATINDLEDSIYKRNTLSNVLKSSYNDAQHDKVNGHFRTGKSIGNDIRTIKISPDQMYNIYQTVRNTNPQAKMVYFDLGKDKDGAILNFANRFNSSTVQDREVHSYIVKDDQGNYLALNYTKVDANKTFINCYITNSTDSEKVGTLLRTFIAHKGDFKAIATANSEIGNYNAQFNKSVMAVAGFKQTGFIKTGKYLSLNNPNKSNVSYYAYAPYSENYDIHVKEYARNENVNGKTGLFSTKAWSNALSLSWSWLSKDKKYFKTQASIKANESELKKAGQVESQNTNVNKKDADDIANFILNNGGTVDGKTAKDIKPVEEVKLTPEEQKAKELNDAIENYQKNADILKKNNVVITDGKVNYVIKKYSQKNLPKVDLKYTDKTRTSTLFKKKIKNNIYKDAKQETAYDAGVESYVAYIKGEEATPVNIENKKAFDAIDIEELSDDEIKAMNDAEVLLSMKKLGKFDDLPKGKDGLTIVDDRQIQVGKSELKDGAVSDVTLKMVGKEVSKLSESKDSQEFKSNLTKLVNDAKDAVTKNEILKLAQVYLTDDKIGLSELIKSIGLEKSTEDADSYSQLIRNNFNEAQYIIENGFEIGKDDKGSPVFSGSQQHYYNLSQEVIKDYIKKTYGKLPRKARVEKEKAITRELYKYSYDALAIDRNNIPKIKTSDFLSNKEFIKKFGKNYKDYFINTKAMVSDDYKKDVNVTELQKAITLDIKKITDSKMTDEEKTEIKRIVRDFKSSLEVKLVYHKFFNLNELLSISRNADLIKDLNLFYPNLINDLKAANSDIITEEDYNYIFKNTKESDYVAQANETTKNDKGEEVHKNAILWENLGKVKGSLKEKIETYSNSDLQNDMANIENKYGADAVKEIGDTVIDIFRGYRLYALQNGLMSKQLYDNLERLYPHYVPTYRDIVKSTGKLSAYNDTSKLIKSAKGSSQVIVDLNESIDRMTREIVRAKTTNYINNVISAKMENDNIQNPLYEAHEFMKVAPDGSKTYYQKDRIPKNLEVDTFTTDPYEASTTNANVLYANQTDGNYITFQKIDDDGTVHYCIAQMADIVYNAFSPLSKFNAGDFVHNIPFIKIFTKSNSVFKKLVTSANPFFLLRNPARDIPDAILTTKNGSIKFAKNIAKSTEMIVKKSELWNLYLQAGGSSSTLFSDATKNLLQNYKNENNKYKYLNPINLFERLNFIVEQTPRFTEFRLSYTRYMSEGKSVTDALRLAINDAQNITTNFSRGGSLVKILNEVACPFLNPQVQGACKIANFIMRPRKRKEWCELLIKLVILGLLPSLINELFLQDDEEYQALPDYTKENYYLIPAGNGNFIKIPKGRIVGSLNSVFRQAILTVKGEETLGDGIQNALSTSWSNLSPLNQGGSGLSIRTILSPLQDANSNTTWYGQTIDKQSDLNKRPSERYDSSTGTIAKTIGKMFSQSPKKIQYVLEQYTGIVGDILLPLGSESTTKGTSANIGDNLLSILKNNTTIDSVANNKYVGEFYDLRTTVLYDKNDGSDVASLQYSYMTRALSEINELEDKLDSTNNEGERYTLYLTIREAYKTAIENTKLLGSKLEHIQIEDDADKYAMAEAYRQAFGTKYALNYYSTSLYNKATAIQKSGVSYDVYYQTYFDLRGLNTKQDRMRYINSIRGLSYYGRLLLYKSCGGSLTDKQQNNLLKYLSRNGYTSEELVTLGLIKQEE